VSGTPKKKTCSTCYETKLLTEFWIRKASGRPRSSCKRCETRQSNEWRSRNRERANSWVRRYYYEHHEAAKESRRLYHKGYYLRNRRKLYLKHKEYSRTPRGREVANEALRRYRARRRGSTREGTTLTIEQWTGLLGRFDNSCAWCGVQFSDETRPEQDHVVPVSRGGPHSSSNVVPACRSCNAHWGNRERPYPIRASVNRALTNQSKR